MNSTELLLWIYEMLFKKAAKKFWSEYDKITQDIQNEIFSYYKSWNLDNVHLTLISWFWSLLWAWYTNKWYEWKNKKEDTIPLYIQNFWLWTVTYFNSLTFSLRSKKNNRPIHFNFQKINWWFMSQLQKAMNYWKSAAPYWAKVWMLSKTIMPVVFLWKDEELHNQEKLLSNIYSLYKNRYFRISIKWFYSQKDTLIWLLKLYNSNELQEACNKNNNLKKDIQNMLLEKSNHMRDLNIFIDWKDELEDIENYLKKIWIEYEKDDQLSIYTLNFDEYLKNYIFYEETISNLIKMRDFWLKDLYKNNKFDNDKIFYTNIVKKIYESDNKVWKKLYKNLSEIECKYKENVVNSFLTQPDLSNSLELVQDVFQWYLRWIWIDFDDKYITEISSKMLRFSKEEKKETIFKNINYFNLTKLK